MLHYFIQTIAFQVFFLLVYDLFLRKETFFNWNRVYLLATAVLSIILPFVKIERFKTVVPEKYIISLPEVIVGQITDKNINPVALDPVILKKSLPVWEVIFYIGAIVALSLFLYKLIKILLLIFKNPKINNRKLTLIKLIDSTAAFSFFRYIFLGELLKEEDKKSIVKHEKVHVEQMHSIDLLFFEILRILFWFNPLIYMYQNRITILHEFIADAEAMKYQNKSNYYQSLLGQVFDTQKISFINPFFKQSLIKKRIIMLQKTKSKQSHLFKYALLIPLVFGMLVYTSSESQEKINDTTISVLSEKYSNDEGLIIKLENEYNGLKELGGNYSISYTPVFRTEEVRELWESNTRDSSLKLVVNDLNNLSSEEKEKFKNIKALLNIDLSFTRLIMTDTKGDEMKVFIEPNEFSLANERDDSKAVLLNEVDLDVGFSVVEQAPVFPGCEELTNMERKQCMSLNISKFVNKNFKTKIATEHGLAGRQRINVIFKINTKGNIVGVRSRAPHPSLEEEAIRVIKLLPKMIPGKHDGKSVNVPYSLPIIFQVQDEVKTGETELIPLDKTNIEVPFSIIENVPIFPGCETLVTNEERKKCTTNNVNKHVNRNFNTKLSDSVGLKGRQRINVIFKIDEKGNVTKVKSRAPHPVLENEAVRVIKTLPKMIPGEQKGKKVSVPYSLPIIFQVTDSDPVQNKE